VGRKINTYKGCKLRIPYLLERMPVMKGSIAEPDMPMPVIHPMLPARSERGKIRLQCPTMMGNKGPRSMPIIETY
jgi:hypothetical protein